VYGDSWNESIDELGSNDTSTNIPTKLAYNFVIKVSKSGGDG
jgi:hypothetical protein